MPKQKAFKIEEIKATSPGVKRIKLIYGPYRLRAANVCYTARVLNLGLRRDGRAPPKLETACLLIKAVLVISIRSTPISRRISPCSKRFLRSRTRTSNELSLIVESINHHNIFVDQVRPIRACTSPQPSLRIWLSQASHCPTWMWTKRDSKQRWVGNTFTEQVGSREYYRWIFLLWLWSAIWKNNSEERDS
jgi:hypothetical protein